MPVLSDGQIASVAHGAGFRGEALTTAVAVALAESSGRTDVVNFLGCVGLWQIYQRVHPQFGSIQDLKNPATNARAAFVIGSGGKNWRPWEAYTNGAYLKYMPRARAATSGQISAAIPTQPPVTPGDASAGIPGGSIIKSVKDIQRAQEVLSKKDTWVRIGLILFGIVLLMFGLMRSSMTDDKIAMVKTIANIIPVGKGVKAAVSVVGGK